MHLVYPPKFCKTIVFNFSWNNYNTQEKFETMVMQNLRERKVPYGLCENGELNRWYFLGALTTTEVSMHRHPTTVFCKISVRRSKYCLEFSIAWIRLKISRWPFHSGTIFEAYLINSLRFRWGLNFHISHPRPGYFNFRRKKET